MAYDVDYYREKSQDLRSIQILDGNSQGDTLLLVWVNRFDECPGLRVNNQLNVRGGALHMSSSSKPFRWHILVLSKPPFLSHHPKTTGHFSSVK